MILKKGVSFEEAAYEVGGKCFEDLWELNKNEFKRMSKKDLAKKMFDYGIENVLTGIYAITSQKENP